MWTDAGLNLTNPGFAGNETALLQQAVTAGVNRFTLIGTSVLESEAAAELAATLPGCIATAGVHPHAAQAVPGDYLQQLRSLAGQPQVRAIGECGLDYNRNYSPPATQRTVFREQLELAVELQLPVYLHERDAQTDQLALLREFRDHLPALFTHCFTGGPAELEAYLELDCYIGITGWVCDERRGQALQQAVPLIPANRLVLETDAPFLKPRTIRPRPKTRHNQPAWLTWTAAQVAALRREAEAELAWQTTTNVQRLFGDWPAAESEALVVTEQK